MDNMNGFYIANAGYSSDARFIADLYVRIVGDPPNGILPGTIRFSENPIIIFTGCNLSHDVGMEPNITSFARELAKLVPGSIVYAASGNCGPYLDDDDKCGGYFNSSEAPWRKWVNNGFSSANEIQQPWNNIPTGHPPMTAPNSYGTNRMKVW
jgi:hypothetical protein